MQKALVTFLALLGALVGPACASAATASRINLVTDGSVEPPGDRIDLTIYFFPDENEVSVELRAFARLENESAVKPVAARTPPYRGPRGSFLLTQAVRRPAESRAAAVSIVVPYAALLLPTGMHWLGYEVLVRRGDTVDFVKATDLRVVRVTSQTRTTLRQTAETMKLVPEKETRKAYVVSGEAITRPEVEIEVSKPTFDFSSKQANVRIPGGFDRPLLAMAAPPELPADEEKLAAIPAAGGPWQSLATFEPKSKRTVLYATNRDLISAADLSVARFGKSAATLTYGQCLVNIPVDSHTKGKLEVPGWWDQRNPLKHFLVESLEPLDRDAFQRSSSNDDILLFIHGYNTNFEFSVLRTAQLVHDLKFPGQGLAFSWPSAGAVTGYFHDEGTAQASVPALVELFKTLTADPSRLGAHSRKIHVIAHSMGNRVFLQAVRQFEVENSQQPTNKWLGQVALAAPDVDGALFGALIPSVVRHSDHVTFYYCAADRALEASRTVHQDKPVGLGPCFAEGIDTINAEAVNTEMLGHGYYASAHELLVDLRLLILFKLMPDDRLPPLGNHTRVLGFSHWSFLPAR